ncbi:UNVERIFIED_CONTAM: hypothetical protein Slati_2717600 [Sesamum latifolium]|uniref:Uncharacterized protein n=1 Tax=Sesamum latifolium TaxID=2727402 RepID=A0AAW2VXD9_9LAMI
MKPSGGELGRSPRAGTLSTNSSGIPNLDLRLPISSSLTQEWEALQDSVPDSTSKSFVFVCSNSSLQILFLLLTSSSPYPSEGDNCFKYQERPQD